MNISSRLVILSFACSLGLGLGCAHHAAPTDTTAAKTDSSDKGMRATNSGNVALSDDILKACNIQLSDPTKAPTFDTEKDALSPEDRSVLEQVAKCVTTGPLKGKALRLVGRADSRGEAEYNMALGEHRADSVGGYLAKLGVDKGKLEETSRGKLDATGTTPEAMAQDRRVDILLKP